MAKEESKMKVDNLSTMRNGSSGKKNLRMKIKKYALLTIFYQKLLPMAKEQNKMKIK